MKVLIVGAGGREHALAWKLKESPLVEKLYCAPGNGGTGTLAENVPIAVDDLPGLVNFAQSQAIDFVVVGPELPLTLGLVDALAQAGIEAFGPSRLAAELEGSKAFSKDFMARHGIATAAYGVYESAPEAKVFARTLEGPWVVKADGLASGKGVIICPTVEEAEAAIDAILTEKSFGDAGQKVVIEAFLEGEELSLMAFSDGQTVVPMLCAQDHKRVFDGDQGPNTGGMGAYAPAPLGTPELVAEAQKTILQPVVDAMALEGRPFKGVLYAGLMVTKEGPLVLEFNARFGDPETEVVLPMLEGDLLPILQACVRGTLEETPVQWKEGACVTVVMAAQGYPQNPRKGDEIEGLDQVPASALVFHCGTRRQEDKLVSAGGRVLSVTALGQDLQEALAQCYEAVETIRFEGAHYRKDIAHRAIRSVQ